MYLMNNLHGCVPDLFNTWKLVMHLDWHFCWTICITFGSYLFEKLPISFLVSTFVSISIHLQVNFVHCTIFPPVHVF